MADLRSLIADYLQNTKLMQLATANSDAQPWVCSVWFAFDDDLNLYWFSRGSRRHSKEVAANDKVAGAVVTPQAPSGAPRGLQFQGLAAKVTDTDEIAHARSVFEDRIFPHEQVEQMMNDAHDPHEFYKVDVSEFVLFDAVNFPDDPRQVFVCD
jgi:uncharacterized protein YhbP (UPF0306 family)